jgi:hypothetical protein
MLAAARATAAAAGVAPDFRQASGESLVADEEFDAALCLFTTLGQISAQGDNRRLVERVYAALRPCGTLVVEVPQRDPTVRNLKPTDRFEGRRRYTLVTRQHDAREKSVTELFEVVSPEGTQRYLLCYRLYSREELVELLCGAGFTVLAAYGDYQGAPLGPSSPTMLLIARR